MARRGYLRHMHSPKTGFSSSFKEITRSFERGFPSLEYSRDPLPGESFKNQVAFFFAKIIWLPKLGVTSIEGAVDRQKGTTRAGDARRGIWSQLMKRSNMVNNSQAN